jgi:hypothetical protein
VALVPLGGQRGCRASKARIVLEGGEKDGRWQHC